MAAPSRSWGPGGLGSADTRSSGFPPRTPIPGDVLAARSRQGNDRTMATTKSPITPPHRGHRWSERPYAAGDVTPQSGVAYDVDPFVPYRVILANGPLSPTEDLDTAIIAARQARALGQSVERIEQGARIVLEGDNLSEAIRESDEHLNLLA